MSDKDLQAADDLTGITDDDVRPSPQELEEGDQLATIDKDGVIDIQGHEADLEAKAESQSESAEQVPVEELAPVRTLEDVENEFKARLQEMEAERQNERQGFLTTIEQLRGERREQQYQPPQQGSQQVPPDVQPLTPHPQQLPSKIPVQFDNDGNPYVAPEDLARMIPQAPQAPEPDIGQVLQQTREAARNHLIMRDPSVYAAPTNEFFQLFEELDREVATANMRLGGQRIDTLESAVDFISRSGVAKQMMARHPEVFHTEDQVLDFAEAGISLQPRKLYRAIDGIRVARAPSEPVGLVPVSPPAEPAPNNPPTVTPSNVERLPANRPRPMAQRGRAADVAGSGRDARLTELMDKDPFQMTEAEGKELSELISEVEMEREAAAEQEAAKG